MAKNNKPEQVWNVKSLPLPLSNTLQGIAWRLRRAQQMIARGQELEAQCKEQFSAMANEFIDPATEEPIGVAPVQFAARGKIEGTRLYRDVASVRELDEEAQNTLLQKLTKKQLDLVAPRKFSITALDNAIALGIIRPEVVESVLTEKRQPRIGLRQAGPSAKVKMAPGQIAFSPMPVEETTAVALID